MCPLNFFCSFYDTNTFKWSESGGTSAIFNRVFTRYECNSNHVTSFSLVWLPKDLSNGTSFTPSLDRQDIATITFQLISIISLLFLMIHHNVSHDRHSNKVRSPQDYLDYIFMGTTAFFVMSYIALGLTVFTRTENLTKTTCFTTASVLIFFIYFC
ncbi:unnamed protein product [Rotaria sp. Silwood1]|nr:unnamed protein product [Rotaria sp. Silwood1]